MSRLTPEEIRHEIAVVQQCVDGLRSLPDDSRGRVLAYLSDRFLLHPSPGDKNPSLAEMLEAAFAEPQ